MIHTICQQCVYRCKQDETVELMRCARFHKLVTDGEFDEMVRGMEDLTDSAKDIRRRARELLEKVRMDSADQDESTEPSDDDVSPPETEQISQDSTID